MTATTRLNAVLPAALLLCSVSLLAGEPAAYPAGVVPEKDEKPAEPLKLVDAVAGKHPRLLFTADDIPNLKKLAAGEGKPFFEQLEGYVKACVAPTDTKWLTDATDAQRQGIWKLPTVALHYVVTGDKTSLERSCDYLRAFLKQDVWEVSSEPDTGMGAANILAGAALAYDWLYNDMDKELRDQVGHALLLHARRMYYGGHLAKAVKTPYWQNDPQNNHRWHRDAGLALASLAVAGEPGLDTDFIVAKTKAELDFLAQWLPEDGTSHESPTYMVFGAPYIVLAFDACDRCLGTDLLGHPFFKTTAGFRLAMATPGFKEVLQYGDSGGGGFINSYNFRCTARHKDADAQAGLMEMYKANASQYAHGWFSLVWYNPAITGGSVNKLPRASFYPDLGLAAFRDGFKDDNAVLMFKCSVPGGKKLNEYRNANQFHYINIAHDDPDANMFEIYAHGGFIADNDRYAGDGRHAASSHNTILVNGKGQKIDAKGWTQPLGTEDMSKFARVTAYQHEGKIGACEGEAAASYTGLSRYRRTALWVEGGYVLILDNIAAEKESEITWLCENATIEKVEGSAERYRLGKAPAAGEMQIAGDAPLTSTIGASTALEHGNAKPLNLKQIQVKATAQQLRLAAVFDVWNTGAKLTFTPSKDSATVVVETKDGRDEWTWTAPKDDASASGLTLKRADGSTFELKSLEK